MVSDAERSMQILDKEGLQILQPKMARDCRTRKKIDMTVVAGWQGQETKPELQAGE